EVSGSDLVVKEYTGGGHDGYTEFYRVAAGKVSTVRAYGRDGMDTISVGDNVKAAVYLSGEGGADYLKAGGTSAVVYGHNADGSGDDNAADMLVAGGVGNVKLYGQGGDDQFYLSRDGVVGTAGSDSSWGGNGNDSFFPSLDHRS